MHPGWDRHVDSVKMEEHDHADPVQESDQWQPSCNPHEAEPLNDEQENEAPEQYCDELSQ